MELALRGTEGSARQNISFTTTRGGRGKIYSFFNLGTRWGGSSTSRPGRFTSGNDPVPIVYESAWAPRPVWKVRKSSLPPGFDPRTVQPLAILYTDCDTLAYGYISGWGKSGCGGTGDCQVMKKDSEDARWEYSPYKQALSPLWKNK
jgi:hypothetical protein